MVRKHMLLPDEKPQINTVTDAERFRVEPFYVNAQNGDKVLVFSRRAILYRPSTDKIIEIGFVRPINPTPVAEAPKEGSASGESVAGASTQQPKVLYEAAPKSGNQ
jgi:hypothetical protein